MAQFTFFNDLNNAVRMDDPILKGPVPRWQKKGLENSSSNMNVSSNTSKINSFNTSSTKTPKKLLTVESGHQKKTPSKTPKKSPRTAAGTPGGDRFIPIRNTANFEIAHFQMTQQYQDDEELSPSKLDKQKVMSENILGKDMNNMRVLAFQKKAPAPPEGYTNPLKVVYSQSKTPMSTKASSRYISQAPDRILDAPEIVDDYYLNLVDWSPNNTLAVALGSSVYLWNATTGNIDQLMELEGSDYVCSVNWIQEGNMLAIGTFNGPVQLWDAAASKRLRVMNGHTTRVGSLAWNSYILTSGGRSGQLIHHDVRQRDHIVTAIYGHSQEVCGLKWSPDGKYLASGGNDNTLNIWAQAAGQMYSQPQPLHSFSAHQAAVKALAWCPWQPSVLASGGGTADRHIRFWNCNTGTCLNSVDTKSQVCALLWSSTYKEIVSGHGYANNQLIIWKYPSLTKTAELTGHTARVLHLAMSPDGTTVLSAGADETLRLWKCFMTDPAKKKDFTESKNVTSILKKSIR